MKISIPVIEKSRMYGSCVKLSIPSALAAILLLVSFSPAYSSTVERVIAKDSVHPGDQFSVELHITVDQGVNYYAIDETYPDDWRVINAGQFNSDDPGHLKMVVLQNAEDTVYTYKLKTSLGSGVFGCYGEFQFEGDGEPTEIEGDGEILVGQCFVDADCDDGNSCTDDICSNGTCSHTLVGDLDEDADGYEADACGGDDCEGFIDTDPECQPKSGSPRVQSDENGGGGCGSALFGETRDTDFAHTGVAGCLYLAPLAFIWWKRRRIKCSC